MKEAGQEGGSCGSNRLYRPDAARHMRSHTRWQEKDELSRRERNYCLNPVKRGAKVLVEMDTVMGGIAKSFVFLAMWGLITGCGKSSHSQVAPNETLSSQGEWSMQCEMKSQIESVWAVAFSGDGKRLLVGSGGAQVWDAISGRLIKNLGTNAEEAVCSVCFSPDGTHMMTGSDPVRIWDAKSLNLLCEIPRHEGMFSSNGQVVYNDEPKMIPTYWDSRTGTEITNKTFLNDQFCTDLYMGHDVIILPASWDVQRGLAFDRQIVITCNDAAESLREWDQHTGQLIATMEWLLPGEPYSPDLSRDGSVISCVITGRVYVGSFVTRDLVCDFGQGIDCAWISPDGSAVATCGGTNETEKSDITIWDAQTGRCIQVLKGHTDEIRAIAWSPQGDRIASAGDNRCILWKKRLK
jgi:WD40 repeat protein